MDTLDKVIFTGSALYFIGDTTKQLVRVIKGTYANEDERFGARLFLGAIWLTGYVCIKHLWK